MPEDRIDPILRSAVRDDQRTVYLWTFPHTQITGRASPNQFTRPQFANVVVEAYERCGKSISQWSVFFEVHPLSKSQQDGVFVPTVKSDPKSHGDLNDAAYKAVEAICARNGQHPLCGPRCAPRLYELGTR